MVIIIMRIVIRKKGAQKYFYLQHSFRKGGKVVTREIYLGKEIPKNLEEIKLKIGNDARKEIYKKLVEIRKNFQNEWKKLPDSIKEKEKEEIAIAFTYNTNAIEGSTITLEEAREIIHDKIAPQKPLNDVKETEAHANVFLSMLAKQEKISSELLLRWHKEIFGETKRDISGRFRNYHVRVGAYVAPDWQDVKELMKDFVAFMRKVTINPVEFSARVHYRFEKIHPFGDGNGRIGRLIMNNILWWNVYPMLIIEYKKRRSYYKALAKDEEVFVRYFLRRYLSVHKKRYVSGK